MFEEKNALHKEWPHITKQDLKFTNPDQNGEKVHVIFFWFTNLEKKCIYFRKNGGFWQHEEMSTRPVCLRKEEILSRT